MSTAKTTQAQRAQSAIDVQIRKRDRVKNKLDVLNAEREELMSTLDQIKVTISYLNKHPALLGKDDQLPLDES